MSFGFGFGFPRGGSAGAWSPSSLFVGGVQGAVYDPSYLNTYMSGLGPELAGTDYGSGWSNTDPRWTYTASSVSWAGGGGAISTTANDFFNPPPTNKYVKLTYTITNYSGTSNCGIDQGQLYTGIGGAGVIVDTRVSGNGTFTFYGYWRLGASLGLLGRGSNNFTISNVSLREVTTAPNATMFQDNVGTTLVASVEQNVGLILDQSQGLVLGSERVGPTWSIADPSWSQSGSDLIAVNGVNFGVSQPIATIGVWCKFTFEVYNYASGTLTVRTGSTNGITMSATANGVYTAYGLGANDGSFYFMGNGTFNGRIRNISVKSIAGNHAYVTADANRGILRSRFNQLTYSEQFDNAVWTKSNSFIQTNLLTYSGLFENAAWAKNNSFVQTNLLTYSTLAGAVAGTPGTAPTGWSFGVAGGTTTVNPSSLTLFAPTGTRHFISNAVSLAANTTYTVSLNINSVVGSPSDAVVFVLVTSGTIASGSILLTVLDGTGRKTLTFTTGGTATNISLRIGPGSSGAVLSDLTCNFDSPQLVQGSVPGDYQATTSAALAVAYANWDGTLTARKFVENTALSDHSINSALNTVIIATPYTYSSYAKAAERTEFAVYISGATATGVTSFNLSTGAVIATSANAVSSIVDAGNGWYRCSVTVTTSSASSRVYIYPNTGGTIYQGDGTSGIYISDSQLVQGAVPGDYRATTASALPILYTDPLGGLTAMKLGENSATGEHVIYNGSVAVAASAATVSIYAKPAGRDWLVVRETIADGTTYVNTFFNLLTGSVGTVGAGRTATIVSDSNGFYRCSVTVTSAAAANRFVGVETSTNGSTTNYAGDGSSGIYIWGWQLVPTDVFPTNTYQRIAASTDYATGPAFPLYIQTDGTNDAMLTNTINFANGPSSPPLGPVLGSLPLNASPWVATNVTVTANSVTGTVNGNNLALPGLTIGRWYKVSASVASVTGSWYWLAQGTGTIYRGSIGDVTFLATSAQLLLYCVSAGTVTLNSVSVAELVDSAYAPDKMTVTAGVTKLSDATAAILVELSAATASNAGSFYLAAPETVGASGDFGTNARGTTTPAALVSGTVLAPVTRVLSGLYDIAAPSRTMRLNDSQVATSNASMGTGNFSNYPLYLFARNNASVYFTGYFYGAVVVQKLLSAGELASLTNWMEVRTFGKDMSYSYDYVTLDNGDSVTLDNGDPVYTNIYYS